MSQESIQQIMQQLLTTPAPGDSRPRVLCVYAHPDDEMIALGGHLPHFADALFLQATDGAPADNADGKRLGLSRDEYRATRALELRAAFAAAGLPEARHRCLNLPDKEAALHLTELTRAVADALTAERPDFVFTHPYEGGHADHDACAFAVHAAVAAVPFRKPEILESPFYFEQEGNLKTGTFLEEWRNTTHVVSLTSEQAERKRNAFAAFATQAEVLGLFPQALQYERFRVAPQYDFRRPPQSGPAYYERFIPHVSPARFCELADEALAELPLESFAA